jgi:hypothetical protein
MAMSLLFGHYASIELGLLGAAALDATILLRLCKKASPVC